MAVFKCKMCGGTLEIGENQSTAVCDYCGTQQTLPRLDDERRVNLYDRASHFRRNNEFDKAAGIYEQILTENGNDAEAYWSLVLCRYGIEYVEDPATHKRVPTVNRAQFTGVFDDENYKSALANADVSSKALYEQEAAVINELQKSILAISQKEEPFDVFICYKETDNNGRRTQDSVLANDLYHQLTAEGFKVFFSRITLEDKLGVAYEPYIFAALNSAKVMVVLGTKAEYFNAVWVKNEWSRYLTLIKNGAKKVIIPSYRDMDPYNLPEEFSHLQAQDMGKLGFMQDLIRGIKKLTATEKESIVKETVVIKSEGGNNSNALLKRGNMALEDGEFEKADGFFEQVLNLDAENADAYFGKTLSQQHCHNTDEFISKRIAVIDSLQPETLSEGQPDEAIIKAAIAQFTDCGYMNTDTVRDIYQYSFDYPSIVPRCVTAYANEEHFWSKDKYLSKAVKFFTRDDNYIMQAKQKIFAGIDEKIAAEKKKDAATIKKLQDAYPAHLQQAEANCLNIYAEQHMMRFNNALAKENEADELLKKAKTKKSLYSSATKTYKEAIMRYENLATYTDILNHLDYCKAQLVKIEKTIKKKKLISASLILSAIAITAALVILTFTVFIPSNHYSEAEKALAMGNFGTAATEFIAAGDYKDAASRVPECYYKDGEALLASGASVKAASQFRKAGSYKDAYEKAFGLGNSIAAGSKHTIGLRSDGTVVAVGINTEKQSEVSGWTDIMSLATGYYHTVGLLGNGTVVATGDNDYKQCDISGWTDIMAVAAGSSHTFGLKSDGTMVVSESYNPDQYNVSDWTDIIAIDAGYYHAVGLKSDGTVVATGINHENQCEISDWTNIVSLAAGYYHTVGIKEDGTVIATGSNYNNQCEVSEWTDIVEIAAGNSHTVGLKADGTVVAVGENDNGQCNVSDWTDIVSITAGYKHTVGLKSDGTVVAVGYNEDGQCNVSDWTNIKLPKQ